MSRCLSKCFYVEYALTLSSTHSKYQQVFATTTIFGRKMCVRWNIVFAKRYVHVWISMSGRLSYVYFVRIKFEICGPILNIQKKNVHKNPYIHYIKVDFSVCVHELLLEPWYVPIVILLEHNNKITNVCCRVQVSLVPCLAH